MASRAPLSPVFIASFHSSDVGQDVKLPVAAAAELWRMRSTTMAPYREKAAVGFIMVVVVFLTSTFSAIIDALDQSNLENY